MLEAYRPQRIKYSICCPVRGVPNPWTGWYPNHRVPPSAPSWPGQDTPSLDGGYPIMGYPHPYLAPVTGVPPDRTWEQWMEMGSPPQNMCKYLLCLSSELSVNVLSSQNDMRVQWYAPQEPLEMPGNILVNRWLLVSFEGGKIFPTDGVLS